MVRAATERFLAELSVVVRLGLVAPRPPGGGWEARRGTSSSHEGGLGIGDARNFRTSFEVVIRHTSPLPYGS